MERSKIQRDFRRGYRFMRLLKKGRLPPMEQAPTLSRDMWSKVTEAVFPAMGLTPHVVSVYNRGIQHAISCGMTIKHRAAYVRQRRYLNMMYPPNHRLPA